MRTKLDHVRANVADLRRAVAWYQDTLGFEVESYWRLHVAGQRQTFNVTFTNPQVVFTVRCVSGATPSQPTLTVPMGSATYTAPDSQWYPSGNQQSALVYQGAIAVPDLSGGKVRFDKGGTFSAFLSIS